MSERDVAWLPGAPEYRGAYFVVWDVGGTALVDVVGVAPAYIHRDDPNAKLLISIIGGLSYPLDAVAHHIKWRSLIVTPEAP